jgi:hypothetical protein
MFFALRPMISLTYGRGAITSSSLGKAISPIRRKLGMERGVSGELLAKRSAQVHIETLGNRSTPRLMLVIFSLWFLTYDW